MKFILACIALTSTVTIVKADGGGFTYDDSSTGPADWPSLDLGSTVNECGGEKQSGIDIITGACDETDANYSFEPGTCSVQNLKFSISNNGVKVDFDSSVCTVPRMTIPGVSTPFDVLQFHIHSSSEHALDGNSYGAELHIVHQEVGGQGLAVLGFFLEPTSFAETNHFEALIPGWEDVEKATQAACGNSSDVATTQGLYRRHLNSKQQKLRGLQTSWSPYSLVPEGSTFYYYSGSLTTPPCSEIVSWNVVDTPVSLSVREFTALTNFILDYMSPETCEYATVAGPAGGTSRPVQPLNGRVVTHKCPSGTESSQQTAAKTTNGDSDKTAASNSVTRTAGLIGMLAVFLTVLM